jgi:hypothetical protein
MMNTTSVVGGVVIVHVSTLASGGGNFSGSKDCAKCCAESAFEVSTNGSTWVRVTAQAPVVSGPSSVQIKLVSAAASVQWVRYAYDYLVQCPYFDGDGLPLAPFRTRVLRDA